MLFKNSSWNLNFNFLWKFLCFFLHIPRYFEFAFIRRIVRHYWNGHMKWIRIHISKWNVYLLDTVNHWKLKIGTILWNCNTENCKSSTICLIQFEEKGKKLNSLYFFHIELCIDFMNKKVHKINPKFKMKHLYQRKFTKKLTFGLHDELQKESTIRTFDSTEL